MPHIIPYHPSHQKSIDLLLQEIASEFESPVFNSNNSTTKRLPDGYWVALHEDQVIGTVGVIAIGNGIGVLKSMFVDKMFRGSRYGLSGLLLTKAMDYCRDENIDRIFLGTMTQFKAAQKFYEKNGFKRISVDDLPDGFLNNPLDDVFYRLDLDNL